MMRDVHFGPTFIQKGKIKDDDDVEDEPLRKTLDSENEIDSIKISSYDHSPFANKTSSLNCNRLMKHPNGQFMTMLNNIRRSKEETWIRLTSGSYPPTTNDINDPRSRAFSYMDVTIIGDENVMIPWVSKHRVYHCYIHSLVQKIQHSSSLSAVTSFTRHGPRKKLRLNSESYTLCAMNPSPFRTEEFESTSRWICFSVDVTKGMVISKGSCIRVYDPIVIPLRLQLLCQTDATCSSVVMCSRLCEYCPESHLLPLQTSL